MMKVFLPIVNKFIFLCSFAGRWYETRFGM